MITAIQQANRTLAPKKVDNFYVSFLGLPENSANILGRQIRAIDRPAINFDQAPIGSKNIKQQTSGQLLFDTISMEFSDDTNSLAQNALYSQIYRQAGHIIGGDSAKVGDSARFEISIKVFGAGDELVEQILLKNCLLVSVTNSQAIYSNSEQNIITASVMFDMVDFSLMNSES